MNGGIRGERAVLLASEFFRIGVDAWIGGLVNHWNTFWQGAAGAKREERKKPGPDSATVPSRDEQALSFTDPQAALEALEEAAWTRLACRASPGCSGPAGAPPLVLVALNSFARVPSEPVRQERDQQEEEDQESKLKVAHGCLRRVALRPNLPVPCISNHPVPIPFLPLSDVLAGEAESRERNGQEPPGRDPFPAGLADAIGTVGDPPGRLHGGMGPGVGPRCHYRVLG